MDDEKDALIEFVLDDTKTMILNYCNLDDMPDGLKSTWLKMSIDLYRNENLGAEESSTYIASISEGDTSVSFKTNSSDFKGSLSKDYVSQLNKFRRPRKNGKYNK